MNSTYLGTDWSFVEWAAAILCGTWLFAMCMAIVTFILLELRA